MVPVAGRIANVLWSLSWRLFWDRNCAESTDMAGFAGIRGVVRICRISTVSILNDPLCRQLDVIQCILTPF